MTTMKFLLVTCFLLISASTAHAESQPKTHDGFHFQLSGGLGYYSASADMGGLSQSFSGVTLPSSLLLGGTIGNLVIGGGIVLDYAPSPGIKQNGMEVQGLDVSQYIVGLGMYADYYLDPTKGGLHFQGFVGWGGLETSTSGNVGGSDPTGLVTYLGAGYDVWLSDEWSVGVLGRLLYAPLSLNSVSFTTVEPAVVATITWH